MVSVAAAFVAAIMDTASWPIALPAIDQGTIETLLEIMASSMLVIATFSVSSMVAAYASAATTGTPRSFPLIVSDDVSQNALSTFIGAFIFSIVALVALKNGYYDQTGAFVLFAMTLTVFAWVVLTFVRWVDVIARLGRLGNTIDKVERAAAGALAQRRRNPTLGGLAVDDAADVGEPVYGDKIGYVQQVNVESLQARAQECEGRITVAALPGTFAAPGRPLAYMCRSPEAGDPDLDRSRIANAFLIGDERVYDEDPRFGLIALSEIAARALSPAVNDPGTAISIIGTFVRLFARWAEPREEKNEPKYDRVHVPELSVADMFDDAFTSIARDGAGTIEVMVRLQKGFAALAHMNDANLSAAARHHSSLALERARHTLRLDEDIETVQSVARSIEARAFGSPDNRS